MTKILIYAIITRCSLIVSGLNYIYIPTILNPPTSARNLVGMPQVADYATGASTGEIFRALAMVSAFGFFLPLGVISAMECLNRMTFQQQHNRCHRPADALPRCRNKRAALLPAACLVYSTM